MTVLITLVAIVVTLVFVIGVHEAGHALAAWWFKVRIKKVSLGFGRPLWRWKSSTGCEWVWSLFPFGGYVLLANTRISTVAPAQEIHCFDKKPIWQRLIILMSGALANFLMAFLCFVFVLFWGMTYQASEIKQVLSQSPAAHAGIKPGNQIIAIGGTLTPTWTTVGMALIVNWGNPKIALTFLDNQEYKTVHLDLSQLSLKKNLLHSLGLVPNSQAQKQWLQASTLKEAMFEAAKSLWIWSCFFLILLKQLIWGVIPFFVLLGPLGFLSVSFYSFTQGIAVFFFFIAQLSIAVAWVNLLPVPTLDGGSMLYTLLEKIRGKPLSIRWELLLHRSLRAMEG